jgi:arginine decarboxylase
VQFEGYELVEKAIELGMMLRRTIREHPALRKWFDIITIGEIIPKEHRQSGIEGYYSREKGWNDIEKAWAVDVLSLS